jgi:NADH:ubiquinone oxidoreductase subunit K
VSVDWYLVLSALVFSVGAANIALIAFARMWGNAEGQIFAVIVMVVAACEVCIGLGLVVALFRRRLPIDVDEIRELHG